MSTPAIIIGAGQAGIAAAFALRDSGFDPQILEAGSDTAGSWPQYYESLRLFTPAWMNALPGLPFPGDPYRYPGRDEVAGYLRACAAEVDGEIHPGRRVGSVTRANGGYRVQTTTGAEYTAPVVVSATGSFGEPHRPPLPGPGYTGEVLHAADYRSPAPFAGHRIVVVGSGNSAVQIAVELAAVAQVTLAARTPPRYATTEPIPGDSRFWRVLSAAARLPAGRLFHSGSIPVIDTAGYRAALDSGNPAVRPMFTGADGTVLQWPGGYRAQADTVLLATGYRPALRYLRGLVTMDDNGFPAHHGGLSTDCPGLAFLGLEYQRTILSGTVHGVGRDGRQLARRLARYR
ncbi:flavin-containing monooxygenase [Nocardia sp. NPDC003963]